jgi:hypothetical protein
MLAPWVCTGCSARNALGLFRCPCGQVSPQFAHLMAPAAPAPARRGRKPKAA